MSNLACQMDRIWSNLVLSHTVYLSGKEPGSKTHYMTEKKTHIKSMGPIRFLTVKYIWVTTAQDKPSGASDGPG